MHLAYRDERLFVARFAIDLNRELYRTLFPTRAPGFAGGLDTLMVACCVTIGHAEGRPMSASKIAAFLGLSRMTTTRRLAELEMVGAIERRSRRYYVSEQRNADVNTETHRRVIRVLRLVRDAGRDLPGLF